MTTKLVLLRHGQSTWNLENRFTGWTDVPLTDKGVRVKILTNSLSSNDVGLVHAGYSKYRKALKSLRPKRPEKSSG